jgi:hypothetical protein
MIDPQPQALVPPPPLRRCPTASERFTGRKPELLKMARFFFGEEIRKRIFLLVGMGGCGKSQIAFHFFHMHVLKNKKFDPSMAFFVDATTTATLDDSFRAIARSKGIEDSAQAALDWIANSSKPIFLLMDNADDPKIKLHDYLPRSANSSVLITTRLYHAGHTYGGGKDSFIDLEALPEADAVELLLVTADLRDDKRLSARILVKVSRSGQQRFQLFNALNLGATLYCSGHRTGCCRNTSL